MSKVDIVHYNMDELVTHNADINIIWGERSNGKSYQVKHKRAIINYLETGNRFMYVRRLREEVTAEKVEQYFKDVDIEKLSNGEYNCITVYRRAIYLSKLMDDGKIKRGDKVGYCIALSTEQNYAGGSFLDVSDIIFEEFMSRSTYLYHEPDKLMNLYATVDRKRHTTKLWMIGNTISRVCPYLYDWGLHNIIARQKQGTIEEIEIDSSDDDKVKIAIEYCKATGVSSHTIGFNKDMLNTGSWESSPQPHLPKSLNCYDTKFRLIFMYQQFKFIGELLIDKDTHEIAWFIYPFDGEIDNKTLVISDKINQSPLYQRNIYDLSINNDRLKSLINSTFREQNIFYASDLVGTDFKQVIDFSIRR